MTDNEGDHPEWARYRRPTPPGEPGESGEPLVGGPGAESPLESPLGTTPPDADPPPVADATASAGPSGPTKPDWAATGWRAPATVDPGLELRIRRDLGRGRAIVRLTWVAALASLVLGLVALRQAALLVAIDPELVTTEEVQAASGTFDLARLVLVITAVAGVGLAVRWLRGAVPTFERLQELGVVDGPRSTAGVARLGVLWRPAGVPADHAGWSDLRVGDGRRLRRIAAITVILATVVGLVAALMLGAARDADMSRTLRIVSGIDGALWLAASILVGATVDAMLWREAAAARALGVFIPLVDAPARTIVRLLPPALVFVAGVLVASSRPDPWFVPCPTVVLSCDGMLVPVDHDAGSAATIWIVYAVHHAARAPVGTLAFAVGGPGVSGLDAAKPILDSLDEDLVLRYDILFFDQRGVGASEGRDCPHAGFDYATGDASETATRAFAQACVAEAGVDPTTLARYSTHQAAEDLDSIRGRLGIERFALYGESYGTELAQTYAALHPDRLTALIIDGPVDLTRTANEFWSDAAHGFAKVLDDTLEACASDADCHADVSEPGRSYDGLRGRLVGSTDVSFADPDGEIRPHRLDDASLEAAVDTLLYDPAGRMLIQRAIAAAAHGDPGPAARLITTLGSGEGIGVSSFAYHAIICADYRVSPTSDVHDLRAVEQAGIAAGVTRLRTDEVYTGQFPCLFWPYQPADGARPAPITATQFPVFVLGATDDPITPIAGAEAIAARLTDGYLIRTRGGPHVTFGRGTACVDGPVLGYLLDGRRPAERTIECDGQVSAPYVALTPRSVTDYKDALEAMQAVESELFTDPAYVLWDHTDEVRFGCRAGGFVAITPGTAQDSVRFADCAIVSGFAFTGLGSDVFATGTLSWKITGVDSELDFTATRDSGHVVGTWRGKAVDIAR